MFRKRFKKRVHETSFLEMTTTFLLNEELCISINESLSKNIKISISYLNKLTELHYKFIYNNNVLRHTSVRNYSWEITQK